MQLSKLLLILSFALPACAQIAIGGAGVQIGAGSGMVSINGITGAFIFTGPGVSYNAGTQTFTFTGAGVVTSVGLAMPSAEFTVTNSPVTSAGTLTVTKANQTANLVFAGPCTGSATAPTFRALCAADIPVSTPSVFGVVRPDNSSITITDGVISSTGGSSAGTAGVVQMVGSTAGSFAQSHLLDSGGVDAFSQPVSAPSGSFGGGALPTQIILPYNTGYPPGVGAATSAVLAVSSVGVLEVSNAATAQSIICTALNASNVSGCQATGGGTFYWNGTLEASSKEAAGYVILSGGVYALTLPFSFTSSTTYGCAITDMTTDLAGSFSIASSSVVDIIGNATDHLYYDCKGY